MAPASEVASIVQESFRDGVVHAASTIEEAVAFTTDHRIEFAFVDVSHLGPLADKDDHQGCLRAFRKLVPGR
jgi:hypothetical protein